MPYVSPAAVVSGAVISKTTFGDVVKADLDYLANKPVCRVRRTTAQSIPNNTETAITFDAERYDVGTLHSTVSNTSRITFIDPGVYDLKGNIEFATNGTGIRQVGIRLNGSIYLCLIDVATLASSPVYLNVATEDKFIAGDYVELVAYQNSGVALNANIGRHSMEMTARWTCLG